MSELWPLFLLGLTYGATLCTLTCLPYLGPYLLATGNGFKDGFYSSFSFLLGKLVTYTVLSALAAYIGKTVMPEGSSQQFLLLAGSILVIVGFYTLFRHTGNSCQKKTAGKRSSAALLGVSTSLLPCPAVIALFALAVQSGSVVDGVSFGASYGLGVLCSPLLVIGGGMSHISKKLNLELKSFMPYVRIASACLVLSIGIKMVVAGT